jgi:8-oxo-dGTP pyrophosphatase MutT (NUDIX family)
MEPEYACAVITDVRDHLLLQLRPPTARHAPGLLTCFGGRREADEDAAGCLRRELDEELGWHPEAFAPCCELWKGPRFIARFYRAHFPGGPLATEAGHAALWAPWSALPGLPISPWHRAVFDALSAGRVRADLS